MVIFHSYVSLPEGNHIANDVWYWVGWVCYVFIFFAQNGEAPNHPSFFQLPGEGPEPCGQPALLAMLASSLGHRNPMPDSQIKCQGCRWNQKYNAKYIEFQNICLIGMPNIVRKNVRSNVRMIECMSNERNSESHTNCQIRRQIVCQFFFGGAKVGNRYHPCGFQSLALGPLADN